MQTGLRGGLLVLALLLGAAGSARADRIETLTTSLLSDPSWRVRVQAAITLGKLKARERRALQALKEALRDDNDAVRAVSAETLGRIGDASVKPALQAALADGAPTVVAEARKAIELIDHPPAEAQGGGVVSGGGGGGPARWYLEISNFSAGVATAEVARKLHDRTVRSLGSVAGLTLDPAAPVTRSRYFLDGTIATLTTSPPDQSGRVNTECSVNITVATLPEKSIKMFGSCGGIVGGTANPKDVEGARNDCLVDAAKQISEKIQTFLEAHP